MINLTSLKCPECDASLDIPENTSQFFCQYCGTKILLNNSNEHITRHIDEAEFKRAETDEKVKIYEMELKLKELEIKEKNKKIKIKALIIYLVILGILTLLSLLFSKIDSELSANIGVIAIILFAVGMTVCSIMYEPSNKQ